MIEYLGYFPIEIIIQIQLRLFIKRKIRIDLLFIQLKVLTKE